MAAITDSDTVSREVLVGASPPGGIKYLAGFTVRETGNGTAVVDFRDGTDATGRLLQTVYLSPLESPRESFHDWKTVTSGHLFVSIVFGQVVWIADVIE